MDVQNKERIRYTQEQDCKLLLLCKPNHQHYLHLKPTPSPTKYTIKYDILCTYTYTSLKLECSQVPLS